jgi:hypothetical protein
MAQPEQSTAQDMYPPKGSWAPVHAPPPKGAWALHLPPDTAVTARPALLLQLLLAALVLVVVPNLQSLLNIFGAPVPPLSFLAIQGGYFLLAVLAPIAAAALLGTRAAGGLLRALGLSWNGWRGPILALLATTPCWVGFALTVPPNSASLTLLLLALLFPFADELVYRGFGFVFARRALRWYLLIALLVQALAFSLIDLIHFWPVRGSDSPLPLPLQQLLLPFVSALLYALLDLLGGYTLWCGWIWRASVTAATTVFAYYVAAHGLATLLPVASALAAIVLLWLFVPRQPAP